MIAGLRRCGAAPLLVMSSLLLASAAACSSSGDADERTAAAVAGSAATQTAVAGSVSVPSLVSPTTAPATSTPLPASIAATPALPSLATTVAAAVATVGQAVQAGGTGSVNLSLSGSCSVRNGVASPALRLIAQANGGLVSRALVEVNGASVMDTANTAFTASARFDQTVPLPSQQGTHSLRIEVQSTQGASAVGTGTLRITGTGCSVQVSSY